MFFLFIKKSLMAFRSELVLFFWPPDLVISSKQKFGQMYFLVVFQAMTSQFWKLLSASLCKVPLQCRFLPCHFHRILGLHFQEQHLLFLCLCKHLKAWIISVVVQSWSGFKKLCLFLSRSTVCSIHSLGCFSWDFHKHQPIYRSSLLH